jgi:hypothetical protein
MLLSPWCWVPGTRVPVLWAFSPVEAPWLLKKGSRIGELLLRCCLLLVIRKWSQCRWRLGHLVLAPSLLTSFRVDVRRSDTLDCLILLGTFSLNDMTNVTHAIRLMSLDVNHFS